MPQDSKTSPFAGLKTGTSPRPPFDVHKHALHVLVVQLDDFFNIEICTTFFNIEAVL